MSNYIYQKMADVGCGANDTEIISKIVEKLTQKEKDVLDTWHNIGFNIELSNDYKGVANELKQKFSNDDLICLCAYVSAYRNIN